MSNRDERAEKLWAEVALQLGCYRVAPHPADVSQYVESIIKLVREDERKRFREAIVSPEAVQAAMEVVSFRSIEPYAATSEDEVFDDMVETLQAALDATYLNEEDHD